MTEKQITELKDLLSSPKNIVVTTHRNPDGDAIGSSLAVYHYLIQKHHRVTVVTPNNYPEFLKWLPGTQQVIQYSKHEEQATGLINEAAVIFCLDYNSTDRMEAMGEVVKAAPAIKVHIDHHQQPDHFAEYMLWDTAASSTAELVYDFINILNDGALINKDVAHALYMGIATDTGSFSYSSTNAKSHLITSKLMARGVDVVRVNELLFGENSENRLKLLGYCLSEKLRVFPEYRAAYISLSKEELERFNYQNGDTEGVVNYALSVKGIRFATLIMERGSMIRLSFRSKGDFSVNRFARENFDGGGHNNAAGGNSNLTLEATISKFESLLPRYKDQLNN